MDWLSESKRKTKQHDLALCCVKEAHFRFNNIGRLKAKGWKKKYHANINFKK